MIRDDLNKIATGGKLREGEKFYDYTWKPFKRIKSIVWQGAGKKKSDDFFKKFESLFNLFQEERIAYHEITRLRYESEKPYIVILEQYREQLQGALVNSPRKYIEKQESIIEYPLERGTIGYAERNLGGLLLPGESVGKVRKFMLPNGQEVYAKQG